MKSWGSPWGRSRALAALFWAELSSPCSLQSMHILSQPHSLPEPSLGDLFRELFRPLCLTSMRSSCLGSPHHLPTSAISQAEPSRARSPGPESEPQLIPHACKSPAKLLVILLPPQKQGHYSVYPPTPPPPSAWRGLGNRMEGEEAELSFLPIKPSLYKYTFWQCL